MSASAVRSDTAFVTKQSNMKRTDAAKEIHDQINKFMDSSGGNTTPLSAFFLIIPRKEIENTRNAEESVKIVFS